MPKLLSNLRECFGFSQRIKSEDLIISIALLDMSSKLPIGVATMLKPKLLFIFLSIYLTSCEPINLYTQKDKLETNEQQIEHETVKETKQQIASFDKFCLYIKEWINDLELY